MGVAAMNHSKQEEEAPPIYTGFFLTLSIPPAQLDGTKSKMNRDQMLQEGGGLANINEEEEGIGMMDLPPIHELMPDFERCLDGEEDENPQDVAMQLVDDGEGAAAAVAGAQVNQGGRKTPSPVQAALDQAAKAALGRDEGGLTPLSLPSMDHAAGPSAPREPSGAAAGAKATVLTTQAAKQKKAVAASQAGPSSNLNPNLKSKPPVKEKALPSQRLGLARRPPMVDSPDPVTGAGGPLLSSKDMR